VTDLIVGASAGLGRALAVRLAAAGRDLVLVSSDQRDVAAVASDLSIRHGVRVVPIAADLGREGVDLEPLEKQAALGGAEALFFPLGAVAPNDDADVDIATADRLMRVNFLSVAAVIARLLPDLRRQPKAAVVGFGSVAAARGRARNLVYSASKRALQTYFEGLRHASVGTPVRVQFYVVGYLDTNLAFGRRTLLPRADPEGLAARVVRDLHRDVGVVYYPAFWRPVCAVLRHLPWFVFKRVRF
jgi:short-subunit dehydrogenase